MLWHTCIGVVWSQKNMHALVLSGHIWDQTPHGWSLVPDVSTNSHSNTEVNITPANLSQSLAHSRSGEPGSKQDVKDNRTDWQLNPTDSTYNADASVLAEH